MIKIWACDKAFADAMKIAVDYTCQRCHTKYRKGHQGLHLSHHHGRGNWAVRHHTDNGFVHCYGCHRILGSQPAEFRGWAIEMLGERRYEMLLEASRDLARGRRARREKREISKHYRGQTLLMQGRRDQGERGNFLVVNYD